MRMGKKGGKGGSIGHWMKMMKCKDPSDLSTHDHSLSYSSPDLNLMPSLSLSFPFVALFLTLSVSSP